MQSMQIASATATLDPPSRSQAPVQVEWLTDPNRLDGLAGEWRALEAAVGNRTHLPIFDFLATWYRHYAGDYGGSPLVGLARRNGRLVGVAPFIVRRGTVGRIPVTRVELAPSDVPAGEMLVEDDDPEIVAVLLDALVRTARFDVICFDGFDPDSPQLLAVRETAARHRMAVELDDHAYALVDLRAGYRAYHASLSSHYRRNLSQKARKIAALGARVDGIHLTAADDRLEDAVARMIAINEASYKLEGQRLADNHRECLRDLVIRLGRRGLLSLPILSIGGRDAAFILGVLERGCFYDITLAYDESFAKLSPGAFLMQQTLEELAARGVHTAVSHGAHDYKKHWATRFVPQTRLFLFAPNLRASATRFIRFELQPLWQRLRARHA
jgi:CelD/BcsL family acetyltransferase involved in cellulose biosynthesis